MKNYNAEMPDNSHAAWEVVQEYLPQEALEEYKLTFDLCDREANGYISIQDVRKILRSIGRKISTGEIQQILREITGNREVVNSVNFKEFIAVMSVIITDCVPEDEMLLVFRQFDRDGDGYIGPQELRDLLLQLGEEISDAELEDMIREADRDGDGKVSYEEFVYVMTNSVDSTTESVSVVKQTKCSNHAQVTNKNILKSKLGASSSRTDSFESECSSEEGSDISNRTESSEIKETVTLRKPRKSWLRGISGRKKRSSVESCRSSSSEGSIQENSERKSLKKKISVSGKAVFMRVTFQNKSRREST